MIYFILLICYYDIIYRLQLALVVASREVIPIHQFFLNLTFIINLICSSSKRHDELEVVKFEEIVYLLEFDELETGRRINQRTTLKRAGDTCWSSHFDSVHSLIAIFGATSSILQSIIKDRATYSQCGDADTSYNSINSFEFIFILSFIKEMMEIINLLCDALQQQSQEIVNSMQYVATTKSLIQ